MKIAFVYDRINKFGGAERVLLNLHELWPQAPWWTAVYNYQTALWAKKLNIKTSWLQRLPLAKTHHELFPWLTSLAFESFNFNQFEVVISVTSAEAKAVITQPQTKHICYCLTPTRYLWSHQIDYQLSPGLGVSNRLGKIVFKLFGNYLRWVDLINSQRPDIYVAISKTVQARIKKYYRRDSIIIYPPVDTSKFSRKITTSDKFSFTNYFLIVSRLVPYKKIDLAIKACNELQQNLVIVGQGREAGNLKKISGSTITFLKEVADKDLIFLYQHCLALIMPQEEDFGIAAVEVQAAGRPVIAYQKGGATETVIDGKTGLFFIKQTVDSLKSSMKQFDSYSWDSSLIQSQARKFDRKIFENKMKKLIMEMN